MSISTLDDTTRCGMCGTARHTTERTHGVWTNCDDCGQDWWCVSTEEDDFDVPISWGCSGGCEDGWDCDCGDEYVVDGADDAEEAQL